MKTETICSALLSFLSDIQVFAANIMAMTRGGGNRSVSDTINTLGGGPDIFKTISTVEGNCGGITS